MVQKLLSVFVIINFIFVLSTFAKQLPTYVKKCSLSDPKLEQCFVENGNAAIPNFLLGDKKYNVPPLNPLKLDKIIFNASDNLRMTFTKIEIHGLKDAKLVYSKVDLKNNLVRLDVDIPNLEIRAHYKTKGRILVLPFEGDGPATIQLVNGKYSVKLEFENFSFDTKNTVKLKDVIVDYKLQNTIYNFENLFNGNKQLGDELNKFLNENSSLLSEDFKPVFAETIGTVIRSLCDGIFKDVYFKDAFLP